MSERFRHGACSRKIRLLRALAAMALGLLLATPATAATLRWHWEDPFTGAEQTKLKSWITATLQALEELTAPLPFTVHLHLHRMAGRGEPVPWANTRRGRRQGVDFYVDPAWGLDAFQEDWTAAHELSHLLVPYLGERHSWFAEGFASYMQYRVLEAQGVITPQEMALAYRERIERAAVDYSRYSIDNKPFTEAATTLRQRRDYPVYYWGGAVYFMAVDAQLHRAETPALTALLGEYLACCRRRDEDFAELLASLDQLSGTTLFTDQLNKFEQEPGFPAYESALEWAEDHLGLVGSGPAPRSQPATGAAPLMAPRR